MLVGVISDIHGNDIAFEAALDDIERCGCDRIVCLGDVAQGGPQPRESVARLRDLAIPVVMGNSDGFLLGEKTADGVSEQQALTREWSNEQLGPDGLEFLRSFRSTVTIELERDATLLCFHGSPSSYDDVLLPETQPTELDALSSDPSVRAMAGGHTHLQWCRPLDTRIFLNPGSVGLSYNRRLPDEIFRFDPWADCALLDYSNGDCSVEFRQVPYDVERLISVIERSGMPFGDVVAERYRPIPF